MQPDIDAFEMGIQIRRGPWLRLGDRHAPRGGQPSGGGQPEDPATDARGQAIVVGAQDDGPHRQFGWHLETIAAPPPPDECADRSEEHTSELQSLTRISYAVFCLK